MYQPAEPKNTALEPLFCKFKILSPLILGDGKLPLELISAFCWVRNTEECIKLFNEIRKDFQECEDCNGHFEFPFEATLENRAYIDADPKQQACMRDVDPKWTPVTGDQFFASFHSLEDLRKYLLDRYEMSVSPRNVTIPYTNAGRVSP
jgi:hypothetical protein